MLNQPLVATKIKQHTTMLREIQQYQHNNFVTNMLNSIHGK